MTGNTHVHNAMHECPRAQKVVRPTPIKGLMSFGERKIVTYEAVGEPSKPASPEWVSRRIFGEPVILNGGDKSCRTLAVRAHIALAIVFEPVLYIIHRIA